jgi:hypothetical protein
MSGFVPMQASWWETIRATIPQPWPMEAAAMDLRWHLDRATAREGWRPIRFPGRPALCADWGWTDWAVKSLLRDEESWRDGLAQRNSASKPPANRQRTASEPPAATSANADNQQETASPPPAFRQPAASKPPRAFYSSPITHHPSPEGGGNTRDPDPAPASTPPESPSAALVQALGTRPDLRRVPLEELQYRRGMGSRRARQLAELLAEAGVPMVAEKPAVAATGPPTRASPANDRRKRLLDALATARQNLADGASNALP